MMQWLSGLAKKARDDLHAEFGAVDLLLYALQHV
jgi:hypothetical protein